MLPTTAIGGRTAYVEPFAGATVLFINEWPVKPEVLNSINGDLVNLYRVVKHHLDEFVRHFRWVPANREPFEWLQATPTELLTDIQRTARFCHIQRLSLSTATEGEFA